MTLDLASLLLLGTLVVLTSSGMFIAHAWARSGEAVDRLWSMAFLAAILVAIGNFVGAYGPSLWWAYAIGNAATPMTVWAMWSGIRVESGSRPLIGLPFGTAFVVLIATLAGGPDGGTWAGGHSLLVLTAVGGLMSALAIVTGRLRRELAAILLAVVLALAGLFYTVRFVAFVTIGPGSEVFELYLGSEYAAIVTTLLVTTAAFAGISLRSTALTDARREAGNFDPMTGARTAHSFLERASELTQQADRDGTTLSFVVIETESVAAIGEAFGRARAEAAANRCGERISALLPANALFGGTSTAGFTVLLPGATAAEVELWARRLRRELLSIRMDIQGIRVPLTASIGVADASTAGYDLAQMRSQAQQAAATALARGGNRMVSTETDD